MLTSGGNGAICACSLKAQSIFNFNFKNRFAEEKKKEKKVIFLN